MKKIFLFLLLFISVKAVAQFPAPTIPSAFNTAQFFYKISGSDTTVYAKASNGLWFPVGRTSGSSGSFIPLNFLDTVKVHENNFPLILFQHGSAAGLNINATEVSDGRATIQFHSEKGASQTWEIGHLTGGSSPTIGFSLRDITRDSTGIFNVFSISPGDDVFTHNTGLILKNLPSAMTGDSSLVIRNDTLFRVPIGSGGSFLPLTFVADNTVNLHNNALNIVDTASNNIVAHFGGANVGLTVLSALDFSGNSSDLELNRGLMTLAVASGGGTNVKQIVLDTLNKGIEVLNTYGHGISYNSTADYSNGLADSLSLPPLYIVRGLIAAAGGGLPSQTGNSGKFLTTNGTSPSWTTITTGTVTSITPGVGFVSHTPITNSGTMNIDTASTIMSLTKAFAAFNTKAQDASTYVPLTRTVNSKALSSNITLGLASSDFANQGTTTTILHGNAGGNPSFAQIAIADLSATGTPSPTTYLRGDNTWATVSGGGGSTLTRQNITSGTSATVTGGNYWVWFNPSSAISTYTLTLPASPSDQDVVKVTFGGSITSGNIINTLTISPNSGQIILDMSGGGPGSVLAGYTIVYSYISSTSTWLRDIR